MNADLSIYQEKIFMMVMRVSPMAIADEEGIKEGNCEQNSGALPPLPAG